MHLHQQENGIEQILLERIQEYVDKNTPILPFDQNGIGDTKNLFTPEELNALPDDIKNFQGVYEIETDGKGREIKILHPLKLLSRFNPKDFWTPERIKRQVWHGIGTLTGLTAIASINDPSKVLLVIFVDADSPKTVILLNEFIKRNELDTRTIVQRSAHGKRHLFFSIALNPNDKEELELWRKRALLHSTRLFVDNENVIEIKTQSNQATLAPSKHRTDKTLGYVNTSGVYSISEEPPIVYEALIKEIKDRGCIPSTPEEHNTRREKEDAAESDRFFQDIKGRREEDRQDFTEAELEYGFKIITGTDEENLRDGRPFGSIYEKGFRQGVVMAVSGSNFFNNISEQYAVKLVEKIAKHNSSSSNDLKKACELARNTYKRGRKGERIVAKISLIEDFKRVHKDRDGNAARQRYEKLRIALGYKNKNPKGLGRASSDANRVKQADIIVNLARKEVPLFFRNQFREYCAVVKADIENEVIGKRTHYEVVKLDEYAFKSALRHLWIQENIAQNNPAKITIGEDQLKQAIESLKHDVDHSGIPPVETHLRVAWKEVEGVYRYDKCDPEWRQIEVKPSADGKRGVREITSDVMIKEINEWKASKFDKSKTPIFFRRYDVNEEQDTPDLDFYDNGPEDNIFEEFIQVLTNVAGNKSSERAREHVRHFRTEASLSARKKSLLAKVNTLTKLVPDITHFVTSVLGPNGSMKTSFLRCEKDLVDPIVGWELYSPRMNLKEIVLVFAHSWFVAYDNIGKVSDDFINFVCSSTTGTSQDFRKLYNDDVMLRVVIKNVVSIACINRVLNADDILRRSLNEGFVDAKDGGYYQEDSDLKAQFKAMKPKILGYIFSTFSKAIEIKRQMKKYLLGSMASPEKWGEAFAQAMGYEEGEFINAYKELDTIQQGLKLDYNPLVVVYQRLYYDLFVKEHYNIPESQLSSDEKIQRAAEMEARKLGYKEYNYMQIDEALLSYTEYEGIKTTGKDSRWPRNNHELKDRTLAIASDLSRSKPFSVIVRKDSKNRNEIKYVIGTNGGLDRYREHYPLTSENEKNGEYCDSNVGGNGKDDECRKRQHDDLKNRDATFYECITILQQSKGGEKFEIVAKLASERNSNADLYLDGQYKIEESRNAQRILKLLLNHPRVEPVRKRPWTLRWIPDDEFSDPFEPTIGNEFTNTQRIEESSIYLTDVLQNEDRLSENNAAASEDEKTQTVRNNLQNRKRSVRKIEDCSIHEGNSLNLDAPESTTLEAAIAINDRSENKIPKLADHSSDTSAGGIDSITPNSTTLQPAIAIARKSAQELEQQRAKVYDLLQKDETRKKVAEILGISEGSVDRAIKHRKKHQQEQQQKTEQVIVQQQQVESPRQLQQQQTIHPEKVEPVTVHSPEQLLLPPFEEYIKNFAGFDCEWYKSDIKENRDKSCADQIYCFCLIDVHGKREQLHINQFGGDRHALMNAILDVMERYSLLTGYWIFGDNRILSDLDHIKMNCVGNDLQERFERMKEWIKFLDVHKIFSNRAIQGSLSGIGISYREESLNAVATAYLREGKTEGLSGFNVETEPSAKQLEYCLQDAQLCMKLVQKNDYDLLRILYYIGKEVGLDLVETANASGPITWWTSKLESMKYAKATGSTAKWMNEHTIKDKSGKKCNPWYSGGHVLEPIAGQHPNVLTFDVSSMYPTMSHVHNISSETICCECCKDNPDARIPTEVMNDINERLKNEGKEPRPWYYWICKLRTGKLGEVMKDLIAKKIEFKHQKLKLKEKAVKLLVNAGYGTFGNPYFQFYDVRVSELITGYARYTLGSIRKSLTEKGCKIVYGDTDSLFLSIAECSNGLTIEEIISEAKDKYGVIFELTTRWIILLLTDKQKTYLGLTDKYQVDGTTMLGVRSNKPKFFHDVTNYLSSEQSLKRIIDGAEVVFTHIISYVHCAYRELEDKVKSSNLEFIRNKLAYYETSKKPIYEQLNGWRSDIYNETVKEECRGDESLAKSKCYEGRVYQIWKVESTAGCKKENVYSMHPERHLLNLDKYKEELWTSVKDMLFFYGLDKNRIEKLKSELVK